jgi:hypothetical protein
MTSASNDDLFYVRVIKISKQKTKEYNNTYYLKHKQEKLMKGKEPVQCKCNLFYRRDGILKHQATKKCIKKCKELEEKKSVTPDEEDVKVEELEEDICKLIIS